MAETVVLLGISLMLFGIIAFLVQGLLAIVMDSRSGIGMLLDRYEGEIVSICVASVVIGTILAIFGAPFAQREPCSHKSRHHRTEAGTASQAGLGGTEFMSEGLVAREVCVGGLAWMLKTDRDGRQDMVQILVPNRHDQAVPKRCGEWR